MSKRNFLSAATFVIFLAITVALVAQPSPTIVGKWQGDKQGSPWLIVNVTHEKNSELGGTAVFFIFDRDEPQAAPRVVGKQDVRLAEPKLVGNVFSFKIKNEQGEVTMNPSSGEALSFEMILKDEAHAVLKSGADADADLLMVKKE